jgi:hypothetical protein
MPQQEYDRSRSNSRMVTFSAFALFVVLTTAMVFEPRVTTHSAVHERAAIANGILLRVLPLGE